jgi:serine/threonine protein kinase
MTAELCLEQQFESNGSLESVFCSIVEGDVPSFWTPVNLTRGLLSIAFGLDYLHSKGIVHGRVEPSHLLFDRDHRLLLDLSEALDLDGLEGSISSGVDRSLCRYLAPEALFSGNQQSSSDVYSFGVLLYEMLAGRPFFERPFSIEELRSRLSEGAIRLFQSSVCEAICELVRRCLSLDCRSRPSIRVVLDELLLTGPNPLTSKSDAEIQKLWSFVFETEGGSFSCEPGVMGQLTALAEGGDARAQHCYGFLLQNGCGCSSDVVLAARYFTMSDDQGNSDGMNSYGFCVLKGLGVDRNEMAAAHYFKMSADQGD